MGGAAFQFKTSPVSLIPVRMSSHRRTRFAPPAPCAGEPAQPAGPPSLARLLLLGLALFALALPIIGPLDDHHFAERVHTHEHIYPNGQSVPHRHIYESRQGHLHQSSIPYAGGLPAQTWDVMGGPDLHRPGIPGVGGNDGSVAFLTPAAASLLLAVLSAPYHTAPAALRPPAPRTQNDNPLARFASRFREPDGISVAPPYPPPVA